MKTTETKIERGAEMVHTPSGRRVRVIAVDSDPRATVWVCFLDDPDQDRFVPRNELASPLRRTT